MGPDHVRFSLRPFCCLSCPFWLLFHFPLVFLRFPPISILVLLWLPFTCFSRFSFARFSCLTCHVKQTRAPKNTKPLGPKTPNQNAQVSWPTPPGEKKTPPPPPPALLQGYWHPSGPSASCATWADATRPKVRRTWAARPGDGGGGGGGGGGVEDFWVTLFGLPSFLKDFYLGVLFFCWLQCRVSFGFLLCLPRWLLLHLWRNRAMNGRDDTCVSRNRIRTH